MIVNGLDRRTFLLGAAAAGVAAACGGSDDRDPFALVQRFPSDVLVPGEIRLPFGIARAAEFITDGPDRLEAQVVDLDGNPIGDTITAIRRDITPAPYYAFRAMIENPGIYALRVDGGPDEGANFQVMDATEVTIPIPGDALEAFDTPTTDAPGGIDPICTRDPICEFHTMTLTDALASGGPVGYFVGTPAFCQTGTCAPALETLIGVSPEYERMSFVHAEVYVDTAATAIAPAVEQLKVAFEPMLFLADSSGIIVERIDAVWDATELRERLDLVVA